MREYILYMWIGVWLFILPFFGIPGSWKDILLMLTALFVIGHSFMGLRRTRRTEEGKEKTTLAPTTPSSPPRAGGVGSTPFISAGGGSAFGGKGE